MPAANSGKTMALIWKLKPKSAIIHAVTVVPMLAPIMTEMACDNVNRPAFTKLTVNTVVAVDDWTALVTNAPVQMPVKRLVVIVPKTLRKPPPVNFCNASLIIFIPNINKARQPKSVRKVYTVINL